MKVSIIWAYEGQSLDARREIVRALKYPSFEIVEAGQVSTVGELVASISPASDVCVFWADDDKPIARDFIDKMVQPLRGSETGIHLWAGNALAVTAEAVRALTDEGDREFAMTGPSFLKVLLPFLGGTERLPGARAHVALSSTERLAPLCTEAVGMPC